MHPLVEERRVDQPVDAEEVELVDDRYHEGEAEEIDGMLGEAQPGHVAVGEGPEAGHLDRGPDRDA